MEHILVGFNMVAMVVIYLLISLATFLNQFKPEVYLELSVAWRHWVALPTLLLFCVIIEAFILYHCSSTLENECVKITIRRFVLHFGHGGGDQNPLQVQGEGRGPPEL